MSLTAEELRERLHYDPCTGTFTRVTSSVRRWRGQPAGMVHKGHGYVIIKIGQTGYLAHRLAWLYVHGEWPSMDLDHRNGVRQDNRIQNLREADPGQNAANRAAWRRNKTGFKGVVHKPAHARRPWLAYIKSRGRQVFLGSYATPEEASAAYARAAAERYGEFSRS
jgi:hypothetical protein